MVAFGGFCVKSALFVVSFYQPQNDLLVCFAFLAQIPQLFPGDRSNLDCRNRIFVGHTAIYTDYSGLYF